MRFPSRAGSLLPGFRRRLAMPAFAGEALIERAQIDHAPLVRSPADLFDLVVRRHLEFDSPAVDLDNLGFGANLMPQRRGSQMPHIDGGTDRALARIQERPDGIERGVF